MTGQEEWIYEIGEAPTQKNDEVLIQESKTNNVLRII
jgi:hypothetical protein